MRTQRYRPYNLSWWLLGVIALYRRFVSPLLGSSCRYLPTCSAFAMEAIEVHGAFRGIALAVGRVGRCHPFRKGGSDPVPGIMTTDSRPPTR